MDKISELNFVPYGSELLEEVDEDLKLLSHASWNGVRYSISIVLNQTGKQIQCFPPGYSLGIYKDGNKDFRNVGNVHGVTSQEANKVIEEILSIE